ncbi:hypothetical protein M3175_20450 [Robertmurraya korlensis]|uniref:hypothetical protein n=1 Tax=Robertmurraya korlensis TaxID=519977 RepID=UPI00203F0817|nr:hypothetical protein [Robertmurraya korlensis]MCM3603113.1 hypothetical protein [Robertmurraya korlensis]
MFLITYKKGLNVKKSKIEFDRPLTFVKANEMLLEAVTKYKQTGQSMKVSYKITELETGESVFNSKILIDRDIPSLFQLIRENSSAPKTVTEYVAKVENRTVIEEEEVISYNSHVEEKAKLEQLKSEKNDILQQLKKEEKESQLREIEFQKKMREIQEEKAALEKSIQLKEKEEAVKESQRLEALRLLEEEKTKAMERMEEKQELDKKKKEDHERRLKEVEEKAKKAELELKSIETELEKKELERKIELQEVEEKLLETDRKASVLKAEGDIEEVKHQQEIINFKKPTESPLPKADIPTTMVIPKLTFKERLQELDFEEVKGRSIQFVKYSAKGSVNGSKKAYKILKNYHLKRRSEKEEKLKLQSKQIEIDEKIALEKIKFMEELRKERLNQEKEFKREKRQKQREESQQEKIEAKYRAAKKRKLGRVPIYNSGPSKVIFSTVGVIIGVLACIHFFNLETKFPVLSEIGTYIDGFIAMILNLVQRS